MSLILKFIRAVVPALLPTVVLAACSAIPDLFRPNTEPTPTPSTSAGSIDLRVTDIVYEHNPALCDQPTMVHITVENAGSASSPETTLAANYHYPVASHTNWIWQSTLFVPALAAGQSQVISFGSTFAIPGDGTYILRAIADWGDNAPESDESNNIREGDPVVVRCRAPNSQPDLRVGSLALDGNTPVCGDRTRIELIIANTGGGASPESAFLMELLDADLVRLAEVSGTITPIDATSISSAGADLILSANGNGLYHLRVTVDAAGTVGELDDTNNTTLISFYVAC